MEENDDDGDEDHEDELADLESAPAATAEADIEFLYHHTQVTHIRSTVNTYNP
jgi:hypothetical protein